MSKYKIGLEIHAQLNTKLKLFSTALNNSIDESNINISAHDIAVPGSMPFINKDVVIKALIFCKILNCNISKYLIFDRKHYYYHDLPNAFQITQFENPIGINGEYKLLCGKKIKINDIHIECDAGKIKEYDNKITVDYNRCGVPLIEIVTAPDFSNYDEVYDFLYLIISDLTRNDISSANMELGNFRVDVNISSISPTSCRYEIKNLNSFKSIKNSISLSKEMIQKRIEKNIDICDYTVFYDDEKNELNIAREKEKPLDYMYMYEPYLNPVDMDFYLYNIEGRELFITYNNIIEYQQKFPQLEVNLIKKIINNKSYNKIVQLCESIITTKNYVGIINFISEALSYINEINYTNNCFLFINVVVEACVILNKKIITKNIIIKYLLLSIKNKQSLQKYLEVNNIVLEQSINKNQIESINDIFEKDNDLLLRVKNNDKKAINHIIGLMCKKYPEGNPMIFKSYLLKFS